MSYIKPGKVLSPKKRVSNIRVLFDGGEGSWSAVDLEWDQEPRLGLRWNGGTNHTSRLGNPQSRGVPTWFTVPEELDDIVRKEVGLLNAAKGKKK